MLLLRVWKRMVTDPFTVVGGLSDVVFSLHWEKGSSVDIAV